ncbi:hypothetical protein C2845_PM01G37090 [Panicum miliaceum]|uniref:Uncharacterized protein n=1 Tax=Panicum miliaceum TaxID=4540 RepID=A0A3L6TFK5_PANMI|nr:hypothetical protein C2845_PM01G37090 [Panicum miliaceum]
MMQFSQDLGSDFCLTQDALLSNKEKESELLNKGKEGGAADPEVPITPNSRPGNIDGKIPVHTRENITLMGRENNYNVSDDVMRSDNEGRSSQDREADPTEQDINSTILEEESDISAEENNGWQYTKSTRRALKRKHPAVAARKSSRLLKEREGMLGDTSTRGATTDTAAGMSNELINSFAILNTVDDDQLEHLALDCDVSLGGESG